MPKVGMEPIRRAALVKAAIAEVGRTGAAEVTVGQIARAAGMSPALAHHYFGAKEQILEAAMREILRSYGDGVRAALRGVTGPRARVEAIVRASFAPPNFESHVVAAWLGFYVRALTVPEARRLLTVYQRRLRSNLVAGLRPLVGNDAPAAAGTLGALIDGIYIRAALGPGIPDGNAAAGMVLAELDRLTGRRP